MLLPLPDPAPNPPGAVQVAGFPDGWVPIMGRGVRGPASRACGRAPCGEPPDDGLSPAFHPPEKGRWQTVDADPGFLDTEHEKAAAARSAAEAASTALAATGAYLMPPADVLTWLGADASSWGQFSAHWEDLAEDRYAARLGTRRLRRYGHFSLSPATGELRLLPHSAFVQPDDTNPLYESVNRHFDPLTGAFEADPVLRRVLGLLGRLAGTLDTAERWSVKVHPFRVVATAEGGGAPTPEGRHRDGVTLVSSLLVGRDNAAGGASTVYSPDGDEILSATLREPASLLVSDDRGTLHGVSPIRPVDAALPAHRDVLVTTLTPG